GLRLTHQHGARVPKLCDERGVRLSLPAGIDCGSEFSTQPERFVDIFYAERDAEKSAAAPPLLRGHIHPSPQVRLAPADGLLPQRDKLRRRSLSGFQPLDKSTQHSHRNRPYSMMPRLFSVGHLRMLQGQLNLSASALT